MPHRRRLRRESTVPFDRASIAVRGLGAARRDDSLTDYLAFANIQMESLADEQALRAQITRFSDITFVHVTLPRSKVVWRRDQISLDRGLVMACLVGGLEVESAGVVFRKPPGLFLIPPGLQEVVFHSTAENNEILYISMHSRLMNGLDLSGTQYDPAAPVPGGLLAPLFSFMRAVCAISVNESALVGPLETAATEVARSLVRLVADGVPSELSLFTQTMRVIAREYSRPHMSTASLAKNAGRSERTLQAAFAVEGTSVMREVRAMRARASHEYLRAKPKATTAEVASAVGFGSVSSLARALREFQPEEPRQHTADRIDQPHE